MPLRPITRIDSFRNGARTIGGRTKRKVGDRISNATSQKATHPVFGSKFGGRKPAADIREARTDRQITNVHAATVGTLLGIGVGSMAGGPAGHRDNVIRSQQRQINRNRKKLDFEKAFKIPGRETRHLITEANTRSYRLGEKMAGPHHPSHVGLTAMGVSGALIAPVAVKNRKTQKAKIAQQSKILADQKKQLRGITKMSTSAFGVDHGDSFSKAVELPGQKKKMSVGREVTGTMFPTLHGAIAGKRGHKLGAAGTGFAGGVGGGALGSIGAGVLTRGKAAGAGGLVGSVAGGNWAVKQNQAKGRLKPQPSYKI